MGKIKSKQVKRAINMLLEGGVEFSEDFKMNKKILGNEMPSKKMRNKMAGFAVRSKKQERKDKDSLGI